MAKVRKSQLTKGGNVSRDFAKLYNFTGTVDVRPDGRAVWTFRNMVWGPLRKGKPKGRRRSSWDHIYVTSGGVSGR